MSEEKTEVIENLKRVEIPLKEILSHKEPSIDGALSRREISKEQIIDTYQTVNRLTYTIVYTKGRSTYELH